jgi:hypothetical protein
LILQGVGLQGMVLNFELSHYPAIGKLDPEVKFTWDFSDTRRAIARLDVPTQQTAQHFIDFFEGHIDLPTLQARLAAQ